MSGPGRPSSGRRQGDGPARRRAVAKRAQEPLLFRGPPMRLAAAIPQSSATARLAAGTGPDLTPPRLAARIGGANVEGVSTRRSLGGPMTLRLQLSPTTRPGRYEGEVQVGDDIIPMLAEVDPRPKVRAFPRPIRISGEPDGDAEADVVLANVGNVACDVSGRSAIGLLASGALGRAFWRALTFPEPDGKGRLDRFIDDLATEAASLRVTVPDGSGRLEPGESREIRLSVRLSGNLVPGQRYAGTWEPEGLRLPVRVDVAAPGLPRERAR